eukprot:1588136-Prymnesium_polylepis.1
MRCAWSPGRPQTNRQTQATRAHSRVGRALVVGDGGLRLARVSHRDGRCLDSLVIVLARAQE